MIKVGDKVKVVRGIHYWVDTMNKFVGLVTTVNYIYKSLDGRNAYKLENINGWTFYDDSLELVSPFSKNEELLIQIAKDAGVLEPTLLEDVIYAPVYAVFGRETYCLIHSVNGFCDYQGIAKCNPSDEFDEEFGKSLAFSRAISV